MSHSSAAAQIRLLPPPPQPRLVPVPVTPGQEPLPLAFVLPNGLDAAPPAPPAALADRPDIAPWAARLAQAVIEVEAADRPVLQLNRWVTPEIYRRLDRRQQLSARTADPRRTRNRCPEQVRSVHVCQPSAGVAEVSVVTTGGRTCRALALRLERRRGRWLCTCLDWV